MHNVLNVSKRLHYHTSPAEDNVDIGEHVQLLGFVAFVDSHVSHNSVTAHAATHVVAVSKPRGRQARQAKRMAVRRMGTGAHHILDDVPVIARRFTLEKLKQATYQIMEDSFDDYEYSLAYS